MMAVGRPARHGARARLRREHARPADGDGTAIGRAATRGRGISAPAVAEEAVLRTTLLPSVPDGYETSKLDDRFRVIVHA